MSWWCQTTRDQFAAEILVRFEFNKADQKERSYARPDPEQLAKARLGGQATARRSDAFRRHAVHNGDKTHCGKGHPFSPSNTIVRKDGARICKTCRNASAAQYRQKQRVA